jgi:hypothetical protein
MPMAAGRTSPIRKASSIALLAALLCACSGQDPAPSASTPSLTATTGAAGATRATGASGATGSPAGASGSATSVPAACELLTQDDAEAILGGPVEMVADPAAEGLIAAEGPAARADICYYRPVPDDGDRFASIAVFPPGSMSEEEFQAEAESAVPIGFDRFEKDGAILARVGDVVIAAVATTSPGSSADPSASLQIVSTATGRLPPPVPDPANPACGLLTEEALVAALGGEFAFEGDEIVDEDQSGCAYIGLTDPMSVRLLLVTGEEAASAFEERKANDADAPIFEPLPGVGDDAYSLGPQAYVLVGDELLAITIASPDLDASTQLAVALARELATRV